MEMSSQFCERKSETEYKVDHEKTKEAKELTEKEAKTANQKLKPQKKSVRLPRVQPIKRHSMEISSSFCEMESETECKVDHEKNKKAKELKEKESKTANHKLKLQKKLGGLPRVQPTKRHSMEMSSPFCEMESKTEYKLDHERSKEVKKLQEKEAKIANQKLKLQKKLGHLPSVQPIKSHSIIKGEKILKGVFVSPQHSKNPNCVTIYLLNAL